MGWAGHVARLTDMGNAYRIILEKLTENGRICISTYDVISDVHHAYVYFFFVTVAIATALSTFVSYGIMIIGLHMSYTALS